MGKKRIHTHDAYDYIRVLDEFSKELDDSRLFKVLTKESVTSAALSKASETRQVGAGVSAMSTATVRKKKILRASSTKKQVDELKRNLNAFQDSLMAEVWSRATADKADRIAYGKLKKFTGPEVVASADQDLDAIGAHFEGKEDSGAWVTSLRETTADARAMLDEKIRVLGTGDSVDPGGAVHLRGMLLSFKKKIKAVKAKHDKESKKKREKGKKVHDVKGDTHVTTLLKAIDRLAAEYG
jgi:hypothetical protein